MPYLTEELAKQQNSIGDAFLLSVESDQYGAKLRVICNNKPTLIRTWDKDIEKYQKNIGKYIQIHFSFDKQKFEQYNSVVATNVAVYSIDEVKANQEYFNGIFEETDGSDYLHRIKKLINKNIKDNILYEGLHSLLLENTDIFVKQIASTRYHHNYSGGLAKHTWQVAEITLANCPLYKNIDKELALAGAIMHDIGKLDEYENFVVTQWAKDVGGHMATGVLYAARYLGEYEKLDKLINIIKSHHGCKDWGSQAEMNTPEAVIVFAADMQSSRSDSELI